MAKKTPSFVCEVPLSVTNKKAKTANARFGAGQQMYNALLGEAFHRLNLVRQSRWYTKARLIPKNDVQRKEERKAHFQAAKTEYGFSEYELSKYATILRQSWLGEHINSHIAQKLTKRAFQAVEKVLYGKARKVRFKTMSRGIHSLEGKTNDSCLIWRDDHVEWGGLVLPMVKGSEKDSVIRHGLHSRVKYVRIVRRKIRGKWRFYAQLICEGLAYQKPNNTAGDALVSHDFGPSTLATVSEKQASLEQFCASVVRDHKEIRRQQRHITRQRHANNPDCFDEKGRSIKEKKQNKKSNRQKISEAELQDRLRREAAHRKSLHGKRANDTIRIGKYINTEKISYKAWQKMFGRSIGVRAPKTYLSILNRKAESAGGRVYEYKTKTTKLSQTCQCGAIRKKRLSERVHSCECGVFAQRDLYSAFLGLFVKNDRLQANQAKKAWSSAEPLLQAAWKQATSNTNQLASRRHLPSSFGRFSYILSQSESLEKETLAHV